MVEPSQKFNSQRITNFFDSHVTDEINKEHGSCDVFIAELDDDDKKSTSQSSHSATCLTIEFYDYEALCGSDEEQSQEQPALRLTEYQKQRIGTRINTAESTFQCEDKDKEQSTLFGQSEIDEVFGTELARSQRSITNQIKIDRFRRRLNDEEIRDALFGITAYDDDQQLEIRKYLEDIISSITTGDLTQDLKQVEEYATLIANQQGTPVVQIRDTLITLRHDFFVQLEKQNYKRSEVTKSVVVSVLVQTMMLIQKTGYHTFKGIKAAAKLNDNVIGNEMIEAGGAVAARLVWTVAGLFYVAELGVNYRRLQQGIIDQQEFKKRSISSAMSKVGSIAGSSIGGAIGFLIGTAILPGVGSIVGVVVGGVTVSFAASTLTLRAMKRIHEKVEMIKQQQKEVDQQ